MTSGFTLCRKKNYLKLVFFLAVVMSFLFESWHSFCQLLTRNGLWLLEFTPLLHALVHVFVPFPIHPPPPSVTLITPRPSLVFLL